VTDANRRGVTLRGKITVAGFLFVSTWIIVHTEQSLLKAIWPSFLALVLVFLFRKVIIGLLAGGFCGAILLTEGNPVSGISLIATDILVPSFQNSWKLSALVFTLALGGFAALIERGGGLETVVSRILNKPGGDPARRLQGASMGLGLFCFFDGLANSILLGRVTRSLADRCGVSREKMAYLVDSTSSSVACIAFISTWIAFQLTLIQDGLAAQAETGSPYLLYFNSIPSNFYPWFTLLLLLVVIRSDFHIGPMHDIENAARRTGQRGGFSNSGNPEAVSSLRALVPLIGLIVSIMSFFLVFHAFENPAAEWGRLRTYGAAFSGKFGPEAMVLGTGTGILLALLFYPSGNGDIRAFRVLLSGIRALIVPVVILIAAWILGGVITRLDTAAVFTEYLDGRLPFPLLAGSIFLAGSLISFSTGTSWGTMAILMPLAIPAVFTLGGEAGVSDAEINRYLSLVIAAVFSGAVFGDHCSPFSDTTIVSSIACGIEPHEHVRTQMPYALLAGAAALFLGFIPAGYGYPVWISLLAGAVILASLPLLFHKHTGRGNPPHLPSGKNKPRIGAVP